jgi:uncharacterized membrane protein
MAKKDNNENYNFMSNNPDNWKGLFYFNNKDPRVIVPKMNPALGWTLNFGNIYAYLGLIAIILIIVGAQYFL